MPTHIQHVVTKNLLSQFANRSGSVTRKYKSSGLSSLRPPSREGFIPDFITDNSDDAESKWNEIESRMMDVYKHLKDRTFFNHPNDINLAKRFIALHLVRSFRVHRSIPDLLAHVSQQSSARTAARNNLTSTQQSELTRLVDEEMNRQMRGGEALRKILFYWLDFIGDDFQSKNLEIGFATAGSFYIGDNPVVLFDQDNRVIDAGINDANMVFMPFGPKFVVSLKSQNKGANSWKDLHRREVKRVNDLVISAAFDIYYLKP